jgi:acetyl-CoA synthetase
MYSLLRMSWIWEPSREWIEQTNVWRFMTRLGFHERQQFLAWSSANPEAFWDQISREVDIEWFRPYGRVLDDSRGPEWARWFEGGELNIAHNCLDRHAARRPERTAVMWECENGAAGEITWRELAARANRLANALREIGLEPGDRVALAMPMWPEVVEILYACFKLGLIATPIFAGFGVSAIASRLEDSGARIVFTAPELERRGARIPLRPKIDEAVAKTGLNSRIISVRHDAWWRELQNQPDTCASAHLPSETPALLLYTSGTTGKPKGALHTHAGALIQCAKEIWLAFDHKESDRFFWLSDIGWMMGAWSIIGNHHFGGPILLYDGAPDFPAPNRLWETIERRGITTFGVSPTAIRMLMRISDPVAYPMNSLRLLGSTGEPWDETSWRWFFEKVGKRRCPVINISGGTEIIGCFLFPLPIQPLKPCSLGGPAPGMAVDVVDDAGVPVRGNRGYLVCTRPAPSMTRGIWNAPERYIETYWSRWPGWWNHGDWATIDADGHWFLHGRADESMNVAGRKVGPAEIEDSLIEHPCVSEAAVIGVPDQLKGEAIVCFAVLKPGCSVLPAELIRHLAAAMGPAFRPAAIEIVDELPKTQSGKIVRRLIRRRYLGEPLGDVSTVANPETLDSIPRQS